MEEKNDDEQSSDEFEDEPDLHGMPETLSLIKNFRSKLKDDEIRRRELKKKVFESKSSQYICQNTNLSTQTMPQNIIQISPKMLLKLIFISMLFLFAFVTIFVWFLSAFVNGRKTHDLSNFMLKEKLNELKDLQKEMKECRKANEYLLNENRIIGQQLGATKPTNLLLETWSWTLSLVSKWFSDFHASLHSTLPEFDNSLLSTESKLLKLAVGVMNAFFAAIIVVHLIEMPPIRRSSSTMQALVALPLWFSFTIMIHFLNSSVQITSLSTSASIVVILIIIRIIQKNLYR